MFIAAAISCSDGGRSNDADAAAGAGGESGGSGGASGAAASGGMSGGTGMPGGTGGNDRDGCGPVLREARCLGEWCWDGPWTTSGDLFAIDGTRDAESVWAVGSLGTALRYCGGRWLPIETGVREHLYDVFSPTNDFAVAVGEAGTVIVWNGSEWSRVDMPTEHTLRAVWGASPSDVWIGADVSVDYEADNLFRFDGSAITETQATTSSILAMRGRSSNDIYAVGRLGFDTTADHYDGTTWTQTFAHADPSASSFEQVAFGAKNRTYAMAFDYVATDDRPGWVAVFQAMAQLRALYLDEAQTPTVVTLDYEDPIMPGPVFKEGEDGTWAMTSERLPIEPEEVWVGAGHTWAVGKGNALVERAADGVWAQVPDFNWQLGTPIALSGLSEDDAYLVTSLGVYRRSAGGWSAVMRSEDWLTGGSIDRNGNVYVFAFGTTPRYYDGSAWHEVAIDENHAGNEQIAGFAPDDIWTYKGSSASHFDGSAWIHTYEMCEPRYRDEPTRFRQAPDGAVWGVTATQAVRFAWPSTACTHVTLDEGGLQVSGTDPLTDIAWTDDGQLWGISLFGRLFRGNGETFEADETPAVDVIPGPMTDTTMLPRVTELHAIPGNKLRYLMSKQWQFDNAQRHVATSRLITVDTANTAAEPQVDELPMSGPLWALDEARTFVAFPGGVLSRGVEHAPIVLEVGSPGGSSDGITTNDVPYEQIFCEPPDVTGQPIVVPCTTAFDVWVTSTKPTPGGSMCNGGRSYSVSLVTNIFHWSRCFENPDSPWTGESGSRVLTDDELSALIDGLRVLTLSSATECTGPDPFATKEAAVTTRSASVHYLDSAYGCADELFVDNIDEALDLLDAMAH